MASSPPASSQFLRLAPEVRARIYEYYFSKPIVRLTRPLTGGRARVFAQTRIGLMLVCRQVYLESQPRCVASVTLILKNTRLGHLAHTPAFSPLEFIQCVELVDRSDLSLDTTCLPSLKVLRLSMSPSSALVNYTSREQIESILEGAQDTLLMERGQQLLAGCRESGRHWVQDLILDPSRNYQIVHIVERDFIPRHVFRSAPAVLRPYSRVMLTLEYDVDTSEVLQRTVYDLRARTVRFCESGKDELYHLCKDGTPGRLLRNNAGKKGEKGSE